jgi:hypothetical protein
MAGIVVAAAGAVIGGGISAIVGGAAKRRARRRQRQLEAQIASLEANRQDIINPFAGAASQLTNPFANLTVATQAAEFQAQQTDLSLASTLDTLRATGAGAGGATALAQAALSAKQGVSASIAQQEAQNERLRAQGQMSLERALFDAEARGKQFVFGAQERREMQRLNRLSSLAGAASQQAAAAESQQMAGLGQLAGGVGSLTAAGIMTDGFSEPLPSESSSARTTPSVTPSFDVGSGPFESDRRLKKNIKQIGRSPSGLKIYSFEYKNKKGVYQGVMSDEIPSSAVVAGKDGFNMVDYSKIDVEFKLIK